MPANPFEQPLEIPVVTPRRIVAGIYASHAGACLPVLVSGLSGYIQTLLLVIVLISLRYNYGLYIAQQNPARVVRLLLNIRNEWWLKTRSGLSVQANLQPGAFVHPQLIVLSFRADKQKYRVILTPDMVNADDHRRLRVRLRHQHDLTSS